MTTPDAPILLSILPPALADLLRHAEVYGRMGPEDLRETAKFYEQTNILGLAAHELLRPAEEAALEETGATLADLRGGVRRAIREAFLRDPAIWVHGCLGGGAGSPVSVAAVIPQCAAQMAAGVQAALWPDRLAPEARPPVDLCLVMIPEGQRQLFLALARERIVITLGSDDLRPGLLAALELAHRLWRPPGPKADCGCEGDEEAAHAHEPPCGPMLLPGGSFPVFADANAGECDLVVSGEAMPVEWEKTLVKRIPGLEGRAGIETILAGAEPWIAQPGGFISPFWFNPILPARMLAASAPWRAAAESVDALLFGVLALEDGSLGWRQADGSAFAIVPRRALPAPFARSAAPARVRRVFTHKDAASEARSLVAMGFPPADLV